ncbi:hypothetical protein A3K73_03605 [Candidatus Pacearchaeota archaeon RBG_13_36_9]|nr:MAG: hypothetical protein A3K73_03605 [Candidatus Pacearchaeota archaeon RBG_13_36_9]
MEVFRYYYRNYTGRVEFPYDVAYHFNGRNNGKGVAEVQTFPLRIRVNGKLCEKLLSLSSEQESIEEVIGESKFRVELRGKNSKDSKNKARGAIHKTLLGRTKALISKGYVSLSE